MFITAMQLEIKKYFDKLFLFLDEKGNFLSKQQLLKNKKFIELDESTPYKTSDIAKLIMNDSSDQDFLDGVLIPLVLSDINEDNAFKNFI